MIGSALMACPDYGTFASNDRFSRDQLLRRPVLKKNGGLGRLLSAFLNGNDDKAESESSVLKTNDAAWNREECHYDRDAGSGWLAVDVWRLEGTSFPLMLCSAPE